MSRQLSLPHTGVLVRCVELGGRLRVVPDSSGFRPWFVAFPQALRADGARFEVQTLRPMPSNYYRAVGPFVRVQGDPP